MSRSLPLEHSRITEEQIIAILRAQEAQSTTADVCRKLGVSSAIFYKCMAICGGMDASQVRKLKVLEDEHVRQTFGISERRACTILGIDRSSMRYAHRRGDDGDLRSRLREIALERRRFGYRRLGIMLARDRRWRLDFVTDRLMCSRRFRILAFVDDFTHENLALVVDTLLSGARVACELDANIALRGKPLMIVSDNGSELTSLAIPRWWQDWHSGIRSRKAGRSRTAISRAFMVACATNA